MEVNGISQGRQIRISTYNNLNNSGDSQVADVVEVQPVRKNENASKEFEHGQAQQKNAEEKDIKKAVDKLNKFLEGEKTHVEYERHDKFKNEFIIKIINNKTKEVIKEIPPKKILDMVAEMCKLAGVIFDKKA
ncbi:flagellar protein FlaG [Clostridium aestuarii]|uniref:Flagellar protein FlaG n=1 Tax=Clostridium aestuarii TaxID=338193 RepID=A0ABT4CXE3_9CLOT|nr:flagellar protein FlaG [Clostridium aestuarii]MCY6483659.1 flagellar protein FlaG [Clostridium aestuarii]